MSDVNAGPNGTTPSGNPAAPAGDWYAGIQDEGLRGYVQTKGWKDPAMLADSYRNLEKLQGVPQERLLKLPEKPDDPAWDQVHQRLGRPDKPEGYELKGDEALTKRMAAAMHKLGIPKAAAAGLNAEWDAYVTELVTADEQQRKERDAAEITELKTKWGADYDKHVEQGRRAGREFGLSEKEFESITGALGSGKTLELFQKIGAKLGEAAPFDGGGGGGGSGFGMTPEAARAKIQTLSGDKEWATRYLNGGAAEKEEMSRLQQIAAGNA